MPKITRPKMARASALARPDQSEWTRKSGDAPTYRCAAKIPPRKLEKSYKGVVQRWPNRSRLGRATEPKERSEYLSRRLPHIFIYVYLFIYVWATKCVRRVPRCRVMTMMTMMMALTMMMMACVGPEPTTSYD